MNYSTEKELTEAYETAMALVWGVKTNASIAEEYITKLYEDNLMMLRERNGVQVGS